MNATTNVPHISAFADFSRFCHERAVAKGFWDEPHLRSHYFVLADGELSEAVEADRIGRWAKLTPEQIEELRGLEGAAYAQAFLRLVKDAVEDELADAVIRLADLYGRYFTQTEIGYYEIEWSGGAYSIMTPDEDDFKGVYNDLENAMSACIEHHRNALIRAIEEGSKK